MGDHLVLSKWANGEWFVLDESFDAALKGREKIPGCEIVEVEVIRSASTKGDEK